MIAPCSVACGSFFPNPERAARYDQSEENPLATEDTEVTEKELSEGEALYVFSVISVADIRCGK